MNWALVFIGSLGQAVSSPLHDNSQPNKGLILNAFFLVTSVIVMINSNYKNSNGSVP